MAVMYSRVMRASFTATKEVRSQLVCGQNQGIKGFHVPCALRYSCSVTFFFFVSHGIFNQFGSWSRSCLHDCQVTLENFQSVVGNEPGIVPTGG